MSLWMLVAVQCHWAMISVWAVPGDHLADGSLSADENITSVAVARYDAVVLGGQLGTVRYLQPETLEEKWSVLLGEVPSFDYGVSQLSITPEGLVIASTPSKLVALSQVSGAEVWSRNQSDVGNVQASSQYGLSYAYRTAEQEWVAVESASGDVRWRADGLPASLSSVAPNEELLFYMNGGRFVMVDGITGNRLHDVVVPGHMNAHASQATFFPNGEMLVLFPDYLQAVDPFSGVVRWRHSMNFSGTFTILGDQRVIVAHGNLVEALSHQGNVLWSRELPASRVAYKLVSDLDNGVWAIGTESIHYIDSNSGDIEAHVEGKNRFDRAATITWSGDLLVSSSTEARLFDGANTSQANHWPSSGLDPSNQFVRHSLEAPLEVLYRSSNRQVADGQEVVIGVATSASNASLEYKWYHQNEVVEGAASSPLLRLEKFNADHVGTYHVVVTNETHQVQSPPIELTLGFTLSVIRSGQGLVEISPDIELYAPGTEVTLVANPLSQQQFLGWEGDEVSAANPFTFEMGHSKDIIVKFGGDLASSLWARSGFSPFVAPAVSDDGRILFAVESRDDGMRALDMLTGATIWTFRHDARDGSSPALSPDGGVLYQDSNGFLRKLSQQTGALAWEVRLTDIEVRISSGEIVSSPALGLDGSVFVGTAGGELIALDGSDGHILWRYKVADGFFGPASIHSSPVLGRDGTVYFGCDDEHVYALESATGRVKWMFETGDRVRSSVAIGLRDEVFVLSGDGNLYALDPTSGKMTWSFTTANASRDRMSRFSPVVDSVGNIYLGQFGGSLLAIDSAEGKLRWEVEIGDSDRTIESPAVTREGLLVHSDNLYLVSPETGTIVREFQRSGRVGSPPVVSADGRVIAVNDREILSAWEGNSDFLPDGPWPSFRGGSLNRGMPAPSGDGGRSDEISVSLSEDGSIQLHVHKIQDGEVIIETSSALKEWAPWARSTESELLRSPLTGKSQFFRIRKEQFPKSTDD